jgi:hypothetical protein
MKEEAQNINYHHCDGNITNDFGLQPQKRKILDYYQPTIPFHFKLQLSLRLIESCILKNLCHLCSEILNIFVEVYPQCYYASFQLFLLYNDRSIGEKNESLRNIYQFIHRTQRFEGKGHNRLVLERHLFNFTKFDGDVVSIIFAVRNLIFAIYT